jgi:hypothetical protein
MQQSSVRRMCCNCINNHRAGLLSDVEAKVSDGDCSSRLSHWRIFSRDVDVELHLLRKALLSPATAATPARWSATRRVAKLSSVSFCCENLVAHIAPLRWGGVFLLLLLLVGLLCLRLAGWGANSHYILDSRCAAAAC